MGKTDTTSKISSADLARLRCAAGHAGNTKLTRATSGFVECNGCHHFWSTAEAHVALQRPMPEQPEHGAGGLRAVEEGGAL